VQYRLKLDAAKRAVAERVHDIHADKCPMMVSLEAVPARKIVCPC
jgi:hypothetical protein